MSGIQFQIRHDDRELRDAFQRLVTIGGRLVPALKDIGEANLIHTRERFARERDPEGQPWKPLSLIYRMHKKRGRKILQGLGQRGGLLGSISWQVVDGQAVAVGTNKAYGRIHQLGGTVEAKHGRFIAAVAGPRRSVKIPARPYLGVSTAERAEFHEILADHIDTTVAGR